MEINPNKALVVLSGGQDSTTCLYHAKDRYEEVIAITFAYGQRHFKEIEAAQIIAHMAGVQHHVVYTGKVLLSESPLLSKLPLRQYHSYGAMIEEVGDKVENTFVPMRNLFFLTISANWALVLGCGKLITGVSEEDGTNYPDCTSDFIHIVEATFNTACQGALSMGFRIETPLINLKKSEIVKLAASLPGCLEALAFSHTSYNGEYPPTDKNHANVLRAQGFLEAGIPDPLIVRAYKEGLISEFPEGNNYDSLRNVKPWELN